MAIEPRRASVDPVPRLARLEALAEIQLLYIDYGRHLDAGDAAAYASLFARDAKLRLGPVMRADGRDAIQAVAAEVLRATAEGGNRSVHLLGSPSIVLDGDRASGQCVWMAISQQAGGSSSIRVGRHLDEFVQEDGRWLFARRVGRIDIGSISPLGASPTPAQDISST